MTKYMTINGKGPKVEITDWSYVPGPPPSKKSQSVVNYAKVLMTIGDAIQSQAYRQLSGYFKNGSGLESLELETYDEKGKFVEGLSVSDQARVIGVDQRASRA